MTENEKLLADEGEHLLWETINEQRQEIETLKKENEELRRAVIVRDCEIEELKKGGQI